MIEFKLFRRGSTHLPIYEVVVAEKRKKNGGEFIAKVGVYDPLHPSKSFLREDVVMLWLSYGARMTTKVHDIMSKAGIFKKLYNQKEHQPDATTVKNQPDATTVKNQPDATTVKNQPHATTVKNQPHATTVKNQPHATTVKNQSHATTVKNQPHATTVKNQPDATTVKNQSVKKEEDNSRTAVTKD